MNINPLSVVLVDDHEMVRDGFHKIINSSRDFTVIATFADVESTIASPYLKEADIVVTDISMDKYDGFSLIEFIKDNNYFCKTVVVSMFDNSMYLQQARELGVNGYLSKREASESLLTALTAIKNGNSYFSADIEHKIQEAESDLSTFNALFPKEKQVFLLLAKGYGVKKIATEMDIAIKTVHTHRLNLYKKFGFVSPIEITRFSLKHGIISSEDI